MSKAALEEAYLEQGRSLSDLAKQFGCTRQYVFKRLQAFGIPRRTLSQARCAALDRGRVVVGAGEGPEGGEGRRLERRHVDEAFFERWPPEMAWVLAVIVTDGNRFGGTIRVSQKEPELLEKVRALLRSTHQVASRPRRGRAGAVHYLTIHSPRMVASLLALGVTPNKSLTIAFPEVPDQFLRHIVRGCRDGDGSIHYARSADPATCPLHQRLRALHPRNGRCRAKARSGSFGHTATNLEPEPCLVLRTDSKICLPTALQAILRGRFFDDVPGTQACWIPQGARAPSLVEARRQVRGAPGCPLQFRRPRGGGLRCTAEV